MITLNIKHYCDRVINSNLSIHHSSRWYYTQFILSPYDLRKIPISLSPYFFRLILNFTNIMYAFISLFNNSPTYYLYLLFVFVIDLLYIQHWFISILFHSTLSAVCKSCLPTCTLSMRAKIVKISKGIWITSSLRANCSIFICAAINNV